MGKFLYDYQTIILDYNINFKNNTKKEVLRECNYFKKEYKKNYYNENGIFHHNKLFIIMDPFCSNNYLRSMPKWFSKCPKRIRVLLAWNRKYGDINTIVEKLVAKINKKQIHCW